MPTVVRSLPAKILLVCWVVYLLAANTLLNTSVLLKAVNTWKDGHIQYKVAFSVIPSVVHIYGFQIWHRDANVSWTLKTHRLNTRIGLLPLLNRKFHTSWIWGSAESFHFSIPNLKHDKVPAPIDIAALKTKPLPKTSKKGKKWGVSLQRVRISGLEDIWVDQFRLTGQSRVSGGFEIKPEKELVVGPASLAFENVDVKREGERIGKDLNGLLRVTINPFNPDDKKQDVLDYLDGKSEITVSLDDASLLNVFLKKIPWIRFQDGLGILKTNVYVEKGKIVDPSEFKISKEDFSLQLFKNKVRGKSLIRWEVSDKNDRKAVLKVKIEDFKATKPPNEEAHLTGKNIALTLTAKDPELPFSFEDPRIQIELQKGEIPNLAYVNQYIPKRTKINFKGGVAKIDAHMDSAKGKNGEGRISVSCPRKFKVTYKNKAGFTGNLQANAILNSIDLKKLRFDVSNSSVELKNVSVDSKRVHNDGWWGKAETKRSVFQLDKPILFNGGVIVKMKNAQPIFELYSIGKEPPSILKDILGYSNLSLEARVLLNKKITSLYNIRLRSEDLELSGRVRLLDWEKRGVFLAKYGVLAVGVESFNDTSNIVLHDAPTWYEKNRSFPPLQTYMERQQIKEKRRAK